MSESTPLIIILPMLIVFGKVLNSMTDYGCNGHSTVAGVDRLFVMCKHVFYNESWIDQGGERPLGPQPVNATGDAPDQCPRSRRGAYG